MYICCSVDLQSGAEADYAVVHLECVVDEDASQVKESDARSELSRYRHGLRLSEWDPSVGRAVVGAGDGKLRHEEVAVEMCHPAIEWIG